VLDTIRDCLDRSGTAYITVRRDLPREGRKGRGVWQSYVELPLAIEYESKAFAIYRMT
jgi:hypothetical protein